MGLIQSGLVQGTTCTQAKLDSYCSKGLGKPVTIAVDGKQASDNCAMEISDNWKGCERLQHPHQRDMMRCLHCVDQHREAVNSQMIRGSKCKQSDFAAVCGLAVYKVNSRTASDTCKDEIKTTSCDPDQAMGSFCR
jgi:hypothetical protein